MLHMVVNRDKWNALPKHYQAIMRQAADASTNWMLAKYDAFNGPALKRLIGTGTELRFFANPVLDSAWTAAHQLYGEMAAKNPLFKKALDSMIAFRTENYLWWQVNEYAFDTLMIRNRTKT